MTNLTSFNFADVYCRVLSIRSVSRLVTVRIINTRFWLWLPCVADADIIFCPVSSSSFFFSSPNLSGRRVDVYHTSTHGVALVRI